MKSTNRTYEIRCPVHGFIQINDQEREIIEQPAFQRLRHIRQLAWTEMVYPGAVHTRFEHSLGVMHVATLLFDAIVQRSGDVLDAELGYKKAGLDRFRSLVRLAALLHDIGHSPFSHAAEGLMPKRPDGSGRYQHEEYSAEIIRTEFAEVIENHALTKNHGFSSQHVAALIEGKAAAADILFWRSLITGQLDADRMDYLLRDSLHAGVQYGRYDLGRLVNSLVIVPSTEEEKGSGIRIGIETGGIHAAEALILARYFMFTQVYFHKTRVIYDHHLEKALGKILPKGEFPAPTLKGLKDYLAWDDWRVLGALAAGKGGEHGEILRSRHHYRCVFETTEFADAKETGRLEGARATMMGSEYVEKTAGKSWYKQGTDDIAVLGYDNLVRPLSDHSSVVKELKPSSQTRLYVPLTSRDEAIRKLRVAGILKETN